MVVTMRSRSPIGLQGDDVLQEANGTRGIPMGASRNEVLGGLLGLIALVLMGLAFWFGARP
jgi:hypothetical protein